MQLQSVLTAFLALAIPVLSAPTELVKRTSRTSPPSGCLTVGSGYTYSTLTKAVAALGSSTSSACIFVGPGTYNEQVRIAYSGALTIYGSTTNTGNWKSNTVTFTNSISSSAAGSLDASSTLNIVTSNFKMYNINVVNGYGKGAQAVALTANADKMGFYGCSFSGYQDTLYAKSGHQYYSNCLITGAVDYIFGDASAWFGECTIESNGGGAITAMSRETTSDTAWFVIDHSTVQAASGYTATQGVYLGRPWRVLARVKFQNTALSNVINPAGWTTLASGATPLFYEYNNSGAGSSTSARVYETASTSATSKTDVLGSDYGSWEDSSY